MLEHENFDLTNVCTPVNARVFYELLMQSGYDHAKAEFIRDGFQEGFDLGYRGPTEVRRKAPNLPFSVGNQLELWNKVMSEVGLGRYAGPYRNIPFDTFIQSPIGLVPKDHGNKTRLIFHLSYPKGGTTSVNANTPADLCSVQYPDFEEAIKLCLAEGNYCEVAKSDLISAFRILGIHPRFWRYLVMKAQCPKDQKIYYFVDKCLPFSSAISCAVFQKISDAIAHLVKFRTGRDNVNYLDDYFFVACLKLLCNNQVRTFMQVCGEIGFPVSMDKTVWASTQMTFLGLLIDTLRRMVIIPMEKINAAQQLVNSIVCSRHITLYRLQKLCGVLNFLCKCVIPGRAFTRRLYAAGAGVTVQWHHVDVMHEMKLDLRVWQCFLAQPDVFCRPFIDYNVSTPQITDFYTDASGNPELGAGGHCGSEWFILAWNEKYFTKHNPSIDYLELYALTIGIKLWLHKFANKRIVVFCDNLGVVHMVNNNTSTSEKCMILIRIIVLQSLIYNTRVFAEHVPTKQNYFADMLSRHNYRGFRMTSRRQRRYFRGSPCAIPEDMWPMSKLLPKYN